MAQVLLENVNKHFANGVHAVKDVSLVIGDGELVVLVGPSGCGKSTVLRMIAGLEEVSGGKILIGEKVVNNLEPKDRDVAMVFQDYALYPHMTVRENLEFGLSMRKVPRQKRIESVDKAAKILGIEELLERRPSQLSGGQKQRVAVGRSIVREPRVFLFDEPLSNLDAKLRAEMRTEIARLHQRLGVTTIYVTHDQVEAMTLGHRIVMMDKGTIQQVGAPLDVYNNPVNSFVAGFLGTPPMNFIVGEIDPAGYKFKGKGVEFEIPKKHKALDKEKLESVRMYGIRPEHIRIMPDGYKASLIVVEPLGNREIVILKSGESEIIADIESRGDLKAGMEIGFTVDSEHAHLFDSQGKSIVT
jgi:multiple sugar transport system ATP-binding protein